MDLTHVCIGVISGLTLLCFACMFLYRRSMSHSHLQPSPDFGGELIVTNEGGVVIEEALPHSPELFNHPSKYVTVEFDRHHHHHSTPCAGHNKPDELHWCLVIVRHPHHGNEELRLRIDWNVSGVRAIKWVVRVPQHSHHR